MSCPSSSSPERKTFSKLSFVEQLFIFLNYETKEDQLARNAWFLLILGSIISVWAIFNIGLS